MPRSSTRPVASPDATRAGPATRPGGATLTGRDILVVVENATGAARLVGAAAAMAAVAGSRITGLFATGYPLATAYADPSGWMPLVEAYLDAQRAAARSAEAAFRQALDARGLAGEWIYRESAPTDEAVALAALYDLVVVAQRDPEHEPTGAVGLRPEGVVLGAGRPVLIVPYAGEFPEIGRRVLVAWNASREATRALHDAMFVLARADAVTVIEINPPEDAAVASAADVAAKLTRRGIAANAETESGDDIDIDDLLLSRAADLAADLLVMGGYGHSRLREFVLGGASRGILAHMTLPVLMAH
jgi:nucleotide-binding universal stress UspA family protein